MPANKTKILFLFQPSPFLSRPSRQIPFPFSPPIQLAATFAPAKLMEKLEDSLWKPPPPMVLVDRFVRSVKVEQPALKVEVEEPAWKVEVEEAALKMLPERKAYRASAVRQEPLPSSIDVPLYRELLEGIDVCFSQVAAPPNITSMSLNISWPIHNLLSGYHLTAFISSCHRSYLVLYVGSYRPSFPEPGFYLVYNASTNSVALAPPLYCIDDTSHCDIGAGVAVLSYGKEPGQYILTELLLCKDTQSLLPTHYATLFIWESGSGRWVQREVVLPLPNGADARPFRADMVFAVSSSSVCWVDLLTGILVYNHIDSKEFHFIPLPKECAMDTSMRMHQRPEEFRSICCIDGQTLKFVSIDSFKQNCPQSELMLTVWILQQPLEPRKWRWEKDVGSSFHIQKLWNDPLYTNTLYLPPVIPRCPVISTQQPGIIYLSVDNYLDAKESYVISLSLDRCSVESFYSIPLDENGIVPPKMLFSSDFSSYLNKVLSNMS